MYLFICFGRHNIPISLTIHCYYSIFLQLLDACLRLGSKDNMTALVVQFKAQSIGEGGGVMARRKEREEQMKEDASQATADNIDEKQQEESA